MSDETLENSTLEQEATLKTVLEAIKNLELKFEKRLKSVDDQLEVIREGISFNASRFDRIEGQIHSVRSDISNLKADIRDMGEEIRREKLSLK